MHEWVLLEDRKGLANHLPGLFFQHPVKEVICWDHVQFLASLDHLDALKREGYYLVGFIGYEAGYGLQSLTPQGGDDSPAFPLLHFLVFETFDRLSACAVQTKLDVLAAREASDFSITQLHLNVTFDEYAAAFNAVKHHIRQGDTYQVNLTSKYDFHFDGSPVRLYQRLRDRQKVAYSGVLSFKNYQLLSLSPELFFSKIGDTMCVKPMKGTITRATDPFVDQQHKAWLSSDLKSRSENIMIVDLLRNDLATFSKPGSVKTPQLLQVESFETVHQMVSCVESKVEPNIDFQQIIRYLFPCGSITGAPKRRTMDIINALEMEPRRVYTGAIGYIMPNNDLCFSVAIRTLLLQGQQGELGVGGGILHDSDVLAEFEEMQLKGRFFTDLFEVHPS